MWAWLAIWAPTIISAVGAGLGFATRPRAPKYEPTLTEQIMQRASNQMAGVASMRSQRHAQDGLLTKNAIRILHPPGAQPIIAARAGIRSMMEE